MSFCCWVLFFFYFVLCSVDFRFVLEPKPHLSFFVTQQTASYCSITAVRLRFLSLLFVCMKIRLAIFVTFSHLLNGLVAHEPAAIRRTLSRYIASQLHAHEAYFRQILQKKKKKKTAEFHVLCSRVISAIRECNAW